MDLLGLVELACPDLSTMSRASAEPRHSCREKELIVLGGTAG